MESNISSYIAKKSGLRQVKIGHQNQKQLFVSFFVDTKAKPTQMEREILTTKRKALRINLRDDIYGSFAEIGAGQEVARFFFMAGGASGTIAKTISAYDKSFSDHLYDTTHSRRYVSEERLTDMLDKEYDELSHLLSEKRGENTLFFTFADTLSTINFTKTNEGNGWLGMKFQLEKGQKPNVVVMHVELLENDTFLQQSTIGIMGVNLIYACYMHYKTPNIFIQSLLDNLSTDRIRVTMLRMSGPQLDYIDNRLLGVQLVKNDMCIATFFDRNGKIQSPAEMLYKKNVIALRGSFRPITYAGFDVLKSSFKTFKKELPFDKENTLSVCEITLNNLLQKGEFNAMDFLQRVDLLNENGQHVMVSNLRYFYKLAQYFSQFKILNIRLVLGVDTLSKVLEEHYYEDLKGGILEAFGALFIKNMKLYVYPGFDAVEEQRKTACKLMKETNSLWPLYQYLLQQEKIMDMEEVNSKYMNLSSQTVVNMIEDGKAGWENFVPKSIARSIKAKELFGFTPSGKRK